MIGNKLYSIDPHKQGEGRLIYHINYRKIPNIRRNFVDD